MIRRSHVLDYGHDGSGRRHGRTVKRIAKRRERRQWRRDADMKG